MEIACVPAPSENALVRAANLGLRDVRGIGAKLAGVGGEAGQSHYG